MNSGSFLQHLRRSFGFARKHVEHVNPYYTALFDSLKQGTVFLRSEGGGGRVVARIEVFEEMLTGSSLLSFRRFSLVRFFTARSFVFFFSLRRTDRELGTGCFIATLKGIWILPINSTGNNVTS